MSFKKSHPSLNENIDLFRQNLRKKYHKRLSEESRRRQPLFLYEGKWLNTDEIINYQKQLRKKDRIIFFELTILYACLAILAMALYFAMKILLLPR